MALGILGSFAIAFIARLEPTLDGRAGGFGIACMWAGICGQNALNLLRTLGEPKLHKKPQ